MVNKLNEVTLKKANNYLFLVLSFLCLNVFTEVSLPITSSFYIPSFFLLLCIFPMYYLVKSTLLRADYDFVFLMFLFLLVSAVAAPNWEDINSRFNGVLQMTIALLMFVLTIKLLGLFTAVEKERFFIWFARCVVFFTFLEYIDVIKSLSDQFREMAYTGQGYLAYDSDERDLALGGAIRPKVFTAEPSLVAIGFFVSAVCAFYANKSMRVFVEIFILTVIEYYFLNSPIALAAIVCIFPFVIYQRRGGFIGTLVVVMTLLSFSFYGSSFSDRLIRFSPSEIFSTATSFDTANEKSERLRLVYPYIAALDAISVNPISGLGISGKRSLAIYSSVSPIYEIAMGNNAFASIFIFFGVVGSAIFFWIILSYLKVRSGLDLYLLLTIFVFMQTMGALESARLWVYLGLIVGCFGLRSRA